MGALASQIADILGKTDLSGDLDVDLALREKSTATVFFYKLTTRVARIQGLSEGAKAVHAMLNFEAFGSNSCKPGQKTIAKSIGSYVKSVKVWLRELERAEIIEIVRERMGYRYYLKPYYRWGDWIPLLSYVLRRRDVGQAYKIVLCYVFYRQGGNDWCWPEQEDMAKELGMTVQKVQRTLRWARAKAEIQRRLLKRNRNQGNKYALTLGAKIGGRVFGSKCHPSKCAPTNNTISAKTYFKALRANFHPGGLSASHSVPLLNTELVFERLICCGVDEKVARKMAFEQLHPFESVDNAINNAQILHAQKWKRSDDAGLPRQKFNVAGYVVAALNGARREGKIVGTTRLFREAGAMSQAIKVAKARSKNRKPRSEEEVKAWVIEQKRALGLPAGRKENSVLELPGKT